MPPVNRPSCRRRCRQFIRLITYNVISAGGNNLNVVLREMNHMFARVGLLPNVNKTKVMVSVGFSSSRLYV